MSGITHFVENHFVEIHEVDQKIGGWSLDQKATYGIFYLGNQQQVK